MKGSIHRPRKSSGIMLFIQGTSLVFMPCDFIGGIFVFEVMIFLVFHFSL